MVIAYRQLAQNCPNLEVVGFVTEVTVIDMDKFFSHTYEDEDVDLHLKAVPATLREDLMESWVRSSLREQIEFKVYRPLSFYVKLDDEG